MNNGDDQTQRGSDKKSGEILEDVGVGVFDENPLGASGTSTGSSERITDNSAQNQLGPCQLGPHKTRPLPTRPKFIRQLGPNR